MLATRERPEVAVSLGSLRVKIDLLRHTASANGLKAALRLLARNVKIFWGTKRAELVYPHVEWGYGVDIRGLLALRGWGTVVIGNNVTFNNWAGVTIVAKESVRIGRHSYIGVCEISDSDFHGIAADERDTPGVVRPVVIEENVWICPGAQIMRGVTVGRDSVIGAGAVVRRDVPPGKIMIGNPAEEVGVVPNSAGTGHA